VTDFAARVAEERLRLAAEDPEGEAEAVAPMTPELWDREQAAHPRPDLEPTEFRKLGFGTYRLSLPDRNARIEVSEVGTGREGTRAVLRIYAANPGVRSVPGTEGLIALEQTNLLAGTTRAGLARRLAERAPGVPWDTALEEVVVRVLQAEREPSPVLRLAGLPPRVDPGPRLDPILPADVPIIVFGAGGTGKSTLAAAAAVSVAAGVALIPGLIPRPAPALLLDWEEDEHVVRARIEAITNGANLPAFPPDLLYRRMAGQLADEADAVARVVAEEGIGLLVVDSVGAAMGTVGEGDQADSTNRMFNALRHLGGAALLVDHIAAENLERQTVRKPYGSVYKENRSRGTFQLTAEVAADGRSRVLVLRNAKPLSTRASLPPLAFLLTYAEGTITFAEAAAPDVSGRDETPRLSEKVASLLLHNGPSTVAFLAEHTEATTNTLRSVLSRLQGRGVVRCEQGEPGDPSVWFMREEERP
jgi:hypothetical protein